MKNKKSLLILIPITIAVWGVIAYNIISNMSNDQHEKPTQMSQLVHQAEENHVDTFSIKNNYRDPFLKLSIKQKKTNKKSIKKPVAPKVKIPVQWPEISYFGKLTNYTTKTVIVNLSIDKKERLLKLGESKDDIKLIKIHDDSVYIKYKNETKWIRNQ